jgi:hypothetical protein
MLPSVVMDRKNMESEPGSTMLFAKRKKDLIAKGLV